MTLNSDTSAGNGEYSRYTPPHFVLAIAILGIAALLSGPVAAWMGLRSNKLPISLRARLSALDASELFPYEVQRRNVLAPTMIEALGTKHYISWTLVDSSLPTGDPLRTAQLLVTYYTGGPNLVPHRPEECYLGAGYAPAQAHENTAIEVPPDIVPSRSLPVRLCTFAKTTLKDRARTSVLYTFHCNGAFVGTSTGIRVRTADPRNRHAYFSKVEVSFPLATREQHMQGARKLFERLLPVLMRDHWPDFDAAEGAARPDG